MVVAPMLEKYRKSSIYIKKTKKSKKMYVLNRKEKKVQYIYEVRENEEKVQSMRVYIVGKISILL